MNREEKKVKPQATVIKKARPNTSTEKLMADVQDDSGKVHQVPQRKLPFLVPDGRKHMLRLRRERQLAAGKARGAS